MTFNEIMALVLPSFIAVLFYSKVKKQVMPFFEGLCHLALFMFFTNAICYAILIFLKTSPILFTVSFTLKYSMMAVVIALIVATVYRFIELNIHLNMKAERSDDHEKA